MSCTSHHREADEPLRTSSLFLLGAVAILLIGASRPFVAQFLSVRLPLESAHTAMLRLQYELFGPTMFAAWAVCYRCVERRHESRQRRVTRLAFWLMFVGFNVAFLPTSWRGPRPALITYPGLLISGQNGMIPVAGAMVLIGGCVIGVWNLTRLPRRREHRD